jgi:GWxTD domain-containing protein
MKKDVLATLLLALLTVCSAVASDLRAELALSRFYAPGEGSFVETYLLVKGNSLAPVEAEGGQFYSEVAIVVKVSKGSEVVFQDAYRVKGPMSAGAAMPDFIDQQRIPLKDGSYELDISVQDVHAAGATPVRVIQEFELNHKSRAVQLSDIQLVGSFIKAEMPSQLTKAGHDLVPYTSNFYPQMIDELNFYFEVYNTDRKVGDDKEFLLDVFIENADDGSLAGNLRKYSKRTGAAVIPVLQTFPIKHIPSGNYNIVVEVRDKKNEVLDAKRFFFQRSNRLPEIDVASDEFALAGDGLADLSSTFVGQYNRAEELRHHVRCLLPIATQAEGVRINRHVNFNDVDMMKRFLHNFWVVRYANTAGEEWEKYLDEVRKVNESYSNNMDMGYETDRGRVYLQYGPPDAMADSYFEPNTYPYEIWHYYRLENRNLNAPQSNRRFVFANMSGAGEFMLIHSDADNELFNARWHFDLQKRNEPNINLDDNMGRQHHGSRALQYYNNPR